MGWNPCIYPTASGPLVVPAKCKWIMLEKRMFERAICLDSTLGSTSHCTWKVPKIKWNNGVSRCSKTFCHKYYAKAAEMNWIAKLSKYMGNLYKMIYDAQEPTLFVRYKSIKLTLVFGNLWNTQSLTQIFCSIIEGWVTLPAV